MDRVCQGCAASNDTEALFCQVCGRSLDVDPEPDQHGPTHVERIVGLYENGFETSSFRPDRFRESWWTGFSDAVREEWETPDWTVVGRWEQRIVASGVISPPGRFGHLGSYEREFTIEKIWSVEQHPSMRRRSDR